MLISILISRVHDDDHALQLSRGQISFTADGWDTRCKSAVLLYQTNVDHCFEARKAFLGVTAHWSGVGSKPTEVVPKSAVIGFRRINGSHSGESKSNDAITEHFSYNSASGANLAETLFFVLERAGVLSKVSSDAIFNSFPSIYL